MVKPTKSLRKQAEKAEAVAKRMTDPDIAAEMRALADAYRGQADAIKKKLKAKGKSGSAK
jgi:hypothetical protein